MEFFSDSMAWIARCDGSVTVGRGPFTASDSPPANGIAFYVGDFAFTNPRPWQIPAATERLSSASLAASVAGVPAILPDWQPVDAVPFAQVFQEIMAAIHEGIFEKTVPVVTEIGSVTAAPARSIAAAMMRRQAPLRTFGWIEGPRGFAGATPELLFSLEDSRLETMALAGTARSEDREVFAVDDKEIREHEYVAQTLVSKLLNLGQVTSQPRRILDLGSLVHFLTHIAVELRLPLTPHELLARLHPTPALGPLPRTPQTLALLLDWRQRLGCPAEFGAPFGIWDHGRLEMVVSIRSVWWYDHHLVLPAGCGIIEASRLVSEWRELRLKREAVKQFLRHVTSA